ncbi:hypothetical protein ACQPZP_14565 [Spirillospora sp. CA-142024]|uniref:hypothetical protein n=1 Tax=Spirillospora sp. CA-142024 TaxID=3240036 RepID=UPI003D90075B
MIQRFCDACERPVEQGAEYIEVTVEGPRYSMEDFHTECANAGNLAERIRGFLDGDVTRVKVDRRKW